MILYLTKEYSHMSIPKAQLAKVRKTKVKKIKSEHDIKPVLSGDVIVLSD